MKLIASRRRRLNFKLLLILGLTAVMLYLLVTWWHSRQIRTAALQLRERGSSAREAGNHRLAVEELGRYVGFAPEDTNALADYTDSLSHCGDTQEVREQVFALNEEVLRRRPEEMKIREFQARLALDLHRIPDAASHVETVEKNQALSADLWYVRGRCEELALEIDRAIEAYEKSLSLDENHVEATERLADLLARRKDEPEKANKLLTDLVKRTGSVDALLLRARRSAQSGDEAAALLDLQRAVELAPDNVAAALAFAAAIHRQIASSADELNRPESQRRQCVAALRGQLKSDPENAAIRIYLVKLLWLEDSEQPEAVELLRAGRELEPGDEQLLFALVDALISGGQVKEASGLLQHFGNELESRQCRQLLRSRINMVRTRWPEAQSELNSLIASVPRDPAILRRARLYEAACLREMDQDQLAASAFERTLERAPGAMTARLGLAESYLRMDKTMDAINEYRRLQGVPHIAAFLADLVTEFQYNQPLALRRWEEVERLTNADSNRIPDPVERTVLQADLLLARGQTRAAWNLLTKALNDNPESQELLLVVDQVSALLLDRVLASVDVSRYDVTANNAASFVISHWSKRNDINRLQEYFEQYIGKAVERDELLRRMSLSLFISSELAKKVRTQNQQQSRALQIYGDLLSKRLVSLEPLARGQRLQWLAESGQLDLAISELANGSATTTGSAAVAVLPYCYGDSARLRRIEQTVEKHLGQAPGDVELLNAQAACLSARGQHDKAVELWSQLHETEPEARTVAINLAWLLAIYKTNGEAAGKVLATVTGNDNDVDYLATKACVEIAQGDVSEADTTLTDLTSRSTHLSHLVHLGYVRALQRRFGEASVLLNRIRRSGIPVQRLHPLDRVIFDQLSKAYPN